MSDGKKKSEVEIVEGIPEFGERFGIILEVEPPCCPDCGSLDFQQIIYGYPTEEAVEDEAEGGYILGGCVETVGVSARWFCYTCRHAWR